MGIDADSLAGAAPAQAEAREAGELFEFAVKEPVFLPRRQSAMIPIVNQALAGDKLSLFNAGVNARHPLNGLELENTSGLFLMQGPVTVFEEGRYAGEARLPDTQRGEKRLLAYALDLAAEGKLERRSAPAEVVSLRILRGVLHLQRKRVDTATYTLKNKRDRERVFLIEHPLRPDWELAEPAKGVDKTREAYRWRVTLGGGQSREIPFVEQRLEPEQIILSNIPSELILVYVNQKAASAKLRDALKAVVSQQNELHATRQAMAEKEERVKAIAQDQNRMRENMRAVARNSESYLMWEGKMVAQEKQLDGLNRELETLRAKAQQQEAALARFLEGLNAE